jgi:IS30 family transposase
MSQLSISQREQIYNLKQTGYTQAAIAEAIGKSQGTVSRELIRNRAGPWLGYLPDRAHVKARDRRSQAKIDTARWYDNKQLLSYVCDKLTCIEHWSPEQIAGRIENEYPHDKNMRVSHESIYEYIWEDKQLDGDLYASLRHRGKKQNKRGSSHAGRGLIPNRRDIKERSPELDKKIESGHHESDLIVGKQGTSAAVATIVERVSNKTFGRKISRRSSRAMNGAVKRSLGHLPPAMRKTMTHDNGKEIADHEWITRNLGIIVYCATPYHSWERGLNEHTNGLLRQYYPKGTDFKNVTQRQLDIVIDAINNRPRKILNYRTPNEVFEENLKLCI